MSQSAASRACTASSARPAWRQAPATLGPVPGTLLPSELGYQGPGKNLALPPDCVTQRTWGRLNSVSGVFSRSQRSPFSLLVHCILLNVILLLC